MESIRSAYVARFEAMLAEIKGEAGGEVYPEASQHGEDGSLVFDPDDELPRRIDAVTADGDEYHIERGDPVPPQGEDDFEGYPFKVKLHPGVWEAMQVQLKFQEPPSEGQWEDLAGLLRGWYLAGFWGGYGGYLHGLGELSFSGRSARFVVDFGSAEVDAVHVLLHAVASFGEEMTPVEKITFGEAPTLV